MLQHYQAAPDLQVAPQYPDRMGMHVDAPKEAHNDRTKVEAGYKPFRSIQCKSQKVIYDVD